MMMRLCGGPGCGRAIPSTERYCNACKAERGIPTVGKQHTPGAASGVYDATLDHLRKGTRWQRLRAVVVKLFPFCARCTVALTEIVDHVVPAHEAIRQALASGLYPYDRWAGYYIKSNLQGLCRKCHAIKTVEDQCHVGEWPDVVAKERAQPKKVWTF